MTKIKTIYVMLICLVFVVIFYFTSNKDVAKAHILIRTDKNSYDIFEFFGKSQVTITNNLNEPIYLPNFALENLEVKKDGRWIALEGQMHGILPYISQSISSDETVELQPNPPIYSTGEIAGIKPPATFRFTVPVYFGCKGVGSSYKIVNSCSSQSTIYSNEFSVYE